MKKRYTEEQIVRLLKEHENGRPASEIVREIGVSEQTFYNWKHKYGGMDLSDIKKLKALEAENKRLKELVADLSLDNKILKDINSKNW